ncbi:MAG: DUF2383 domain-containing protein [Polyangiaceae bacterium]
MSQKKKDIDQLNSFLRGELSAVETYQQCIEKVSSDALTKQLEALQESHQLRARRLQERIRHLGGDPADDSGVWGSFVKLVEGGAKLLGERAAVSALEEGEDHGRDDYLRDFGDLSADNRFFIEHEILPEQKRTHDVLSKIQEDMS